MSKFLKLINYQKQTTLAKVLTKYYFTQECFYLGSLQAYAWAHMIIL